MLASRWESIALGLWVALLIGGCGGTAVSTTGRSHFTDAGVEPGTDAPEIPRDAGHRDAYLDPGCPDVKRPPATLECDPFANTSTCASGLACYPYVDPKSDCQPASLGAFCTTEGTGHQGDLCDTTGDCAGGFICVVSGGGNECLQLCRLERLGECSGGRICETLDIPGYGGCL